MQDIQYIRQNINLGNWLIILRLVQKTLHWNLNNILKRVPDMHSQKDIFGNDSPKH